MDENTFQNSPPLPAAPRPLLNVPLLFGMFVTLALLLTMVYLANGLHPQKNASEILPQGARIYFGEHYVPHWYKVAGTSLQRVTGPVDSVSQSFFITEIGIPNSAGTPALVRVLNTNGVQLGLLKKDSTFAPLVSDGTEKMNLVSRPDGLAVFSAYLVPVKSKQGTEGEWTLEALETSDKTPAPLVLGPGLSAMFTKDGQSLIAETPNGIIRIDFATGKTTMLIAEKQPLEPGEFAISDGGAYIVVRNSLSGKFDVFSTNGYGGDVSYVASLPFQRSVTFFGDNRLVTESVGMSVTVYEISKKSITAIGTLALPSAPANQK